MSYINEKLIEFNNYLKGRNVAVIGLGVSNIPLIDYLHNIGSIVTVFDSKEIDDIDNKILDKIINYGMSFSFGKEYLKKLTGFDLIFRSPSCLPTVPELEKEAKRGAIITTEIEMVIELTPGLVIGVTGSDGKTTTTTLIYEILKEDGYNCYLGGNIGIPLFDKIKDMQPEDIIVLELSSFQLMNMKISPKISVVTNITPNHLNIHSDMEEYVEAKKNIFKYQDKDGLLILNYDNEIKEISDQDAEAEEVTNEVVLVGYICKKPIYRQTPFGREIADVLLAVNRAYNKSDYIPSIAWGRNARFCQNMEVGTEVKITGRVQSRNYEKKLEDGTVQTRVAYEVSIASMEIANDEENSQEEVEKEEVV